METPGLREIPFNYTSADDARAVRFLLGAEVWERMELLRAQRVTGRSARLLLRFIGDLFMLRRNPFLYQDMVDSPLHRIALLRASGRDLSLVESNSDGDPDVTFVTGRCRGALKALSDEIAGAGRSRARIKRALGAVVGAENVAFDPFTLVAHATDATDWRLHLPVAVVFPVDEGQVPRLLEAIARLGLKAIPRGAGTGLTGGAVPVAPGCVMVNTEKMDRIRGVSRVEVAPGRTAEVLEAEAGAVTEDAMDEAARRGLVFATDPTSAWASTIGGNIAENAGGKTAVLWGTAIDNLLSFRIAVPGGRLLTVERLDHPLRKILPGDAVRFAVRDGDGGMVRTVELGGGDIRKGGLWKDITNKALGGLPGLQKEGTDGVITSARFILHRAYEQKATFCIEFHGDSMDEAGKVINELSREFTDRGAETLMALEHFDEEYVRAIEYRSKGGRGGRPRAVLLLDMVAHTPAELMKGRARLEALLSPHANSFLFPARDAAEAERFWADRKRLGAIAKRTNAFKLNEDIVLPLSALAEFADWVEMRNFAEDRFNQLEFVRRAVGAVEESGRADPTGVAKSKEPFARELAEAARTGVENASRKDLRAEAALELLREGLSGLYAGHAGLREALEALYREVRSRAIIIATHMHAGDGNVHVNIPVFSNDRDMMARAEAVADDAMRKAVALGGVVSGEHGIGITKFHHLEPERREALERYRAGMDPGGLMNPGKLSDPTVPGLVFTPSFNLLELEARILKHDQLGVLADKIARCVRCGRCKPDCCVFHPSGGMFYHPRNKNLAIGSVIEALLYDAQRFRSTRFEFLRDLEEVADHCTICHKCLKPCPVDIDTGEVSVLEREILKTRRYKHTALATRLTLRYLWSRNRLLNFGFRAAVLRGGGLFQRVSARILALVPDLGGFKSVWPVSLFRSAMPAASAKPLHRLLPDRGPAQALLLRPAGEAKRTVFYFPGCGSERQYSGIGQAAIYLLLRSGAQVVVPPRFLCCGFPHGANAQRAERDRSVLGDSIIFSQIREMLGYLSFDAVAVTCGTCMEAVRGMGAGEIFGASVVDAAGFALANGLPAGGGGPALYHPPCHDSLEGRAAAVLGRAGFTITPVPHCCSEAGTLALSRPDISWCLLRRKGRSVARARATAGPGAPLLTNCPSCISGLGRNTGRVAHITVELALRVGGDGWRRELDALLRNHEKVNF